MVHRCWLEDFWYWLLVIIGGWISEYLLGCFESLLVNYREVLFNWWRFLFFLFWALFCVGFLWGFVRLCLSGFLQTILKLFLSVVRMAFPWGKLHFGADLFNHLEHRRANLPTVQSQRLHTSLLNLESSRRLWTFLTTWIHITIQHHRRHRFWPPDIISINNRLVLSSWELTWRVVRKLDGLVVFGVGWL